MVLLLSLVVAAAPLPPIRSARFIEPIGWSADRHTVALRVFYGADHAEYELCPGYLDAEGKPFRTGLAIVVLRDDAVLHSFVIQVPAIEGRCTPVAAAKQALEGAKATLDELGIDRTAPGVALAVTMDKGKTTSRRKDDALNSTWKEKWRARNGAVTPLELVVSLNDVVEAGGYHTVTTSLKWTLRRGDTERVGSLKLPPVEWSEAMVGSFKWDLMAFATPEGEARVAIVGEDHFNMRGGWSRSTVLPLEAVK